MFTLLFIPLCIDSLHICHTIRYTSKWWNFSFSDMTKYINIIRRVWFIDGQCSDQICKILPWINKQKWHNIYNNLVWIMLKQLLYTSKNVWACLWLVERCFTRTFSLNNSPHRNYLLLKEVDWMSFTSSTVGFLIMNAFIHLTR